MGGAELVNDIRPGPDSSDAVGFIRVRRTIFFSAFDGTHGLWKSDGTTAGTSLVKERPGGLPDAIVLRGSLLFITPGGAGIDELWRSDGTAAGTRRLRSDPTPRMSRPFSSWARQAASPTSRHIARDPATSSG